MVEKAVYARREHQVLISITRTTRSFGLEHE